MCRYVDQQLGLLIDRPKPISGTVLATLPNEVDSVVVNAESLFAESGEMLPIATESGSFTYYALISTPLDADRLSQLKANPSIAGLVFASEMD